MSEEAKKILRDISDAVSSVPQDAQDVIAAYASGMADAYGKMQRDKQKDGKDGEQG